MNTARCTILHIEDDENDSLLFQRAVSRATVPCDVRHVATLKDARSYLLGSVAREADYVVPNVIVTDLAFRGESGLDFLEWLRSEPRLASIPVICVTGSEDPGKLGQARSYGAKCVAKTTLFQNALAEIERLVPRP